MTISYNLDIASASHLNFFRLVFRWKGSIWKLCLKELTIWTFIFLIIAFIYRSPYFLAQNHKIAFERLVNYFNSHLNYIPLTFMLGFFVQIVIQRWSILFENMGFVESTSMYISAYVYGDDDDSRLWRRTMGRYLCLTQLLVYRDISVRIRKRFPSYESIIEAGFMRENEREMLESVQMKFDKYWVPINWIYALIIRARKNGKIPSDSFTNKLCDEIKNFRKSIQVLCNYDWVPIPLAYPQLVFLAVYTYFAICLISRQFIITEHEDATNKNNIDLILPYVTMMEFIIFVGWMKVAEGLLNPFGEDDDDFECDFLLRKNLATSLYIVDNPSNNAPDLEKDQFWSDNEINIKQSANQSINALVGSATLARIQTDNHEEKTLAELSVSTEQLPQRSNQAIAKNNNSCSLCMSSIFVIDSMQDVSVEENTTTINQTEKYWHKNLSTSDIPSKLCIPPSTLQKYAVISLPPSPTGKDQSNYHHLT